MIQEKELRIGNYIMYVGGEIGKVIGINDHGYIAISCDREFFGQSDYDPIPITPEILEKCGFVETHEVIGANTSIPFDYVDYRMGNFVLSVISSGVEVEFAPKFQTVDDRGHIATVKHLHQLQNLYFSLTGTELNVQL